MSDDVKDIPGRVLASLRDVYTDEGCVIWWNNRNRGLGQQSPASLWCFPSEQQRVLDAIDRLAGGPIA